MKVLIGDNSVANRQLLGNYLQQMGHEVIYASNGDETVQLFVEHEPNLVFVEAALPEINGYETTRIIRKSFHETSQWTPIIILSTVIDDESIIKGIEVNADDHLSKPLTFGMVKAKLHSIRKLITLRENLLDFGKQLREANEKWLAADQLLAELALKDPVTRLGNHRAFEENLTRVYKTALREEKSVSLLIVDIDQFKSFNEIYGYSLGDHCLLQIANILRRGIYRASDFCARLSNNTFGIILADTPLLGAMHVAERLRMGVEALQLPHKGTTRGFVTISLGVAASFADKSFECQSLLAGAQSALEEAKQGGRNCIVGSKVLAAADPSDCILYSAGGHFSSGKGPSSKH